MTTTTIYPNLTAAITAEHKTRFSGFVSEISEITEISTLLNSWRYTDLMPAGKSKKIVWDIAELKAYLISRKKKATDKAITKELAHLQTVANAAELLEVSISVEWKKSKMWGANPTAQADISAAGDRCQRYFSGSVSGCGYDKGSTAVADAINQSNEFLKLLYDLKEKNATETNHNLFGYGAGHGVLPRLEGGVGVSCYPTIFVKLGYKFSTTASGKMFDVYRIAKI